MLPLNFFYRRFQGKNKYTSLSCHDTVSSKIKSWILIQHITNVGSFNFSNVHRQQNHQENELMATAIFTAY